MKIPIKEGCVIRAVDNMYNKVYWNSEEDCFTEDVDKATVYSSDDEARYDFFDIKKPANIRRMYIVPEQYKER